MSMHTSAASGYVIEASYLRSLLPKDILGEYDDAVDACDCDAVETILRNNHASGFPEIETVFTLNDEAESETLTCHTVYVSFDESELFVKTPTPSYRFMVSCGMTPSFNQWTTWG